MDQHDRLKNGSGSDFDGGNNLRTQYNLWLIACLSIHLKVFFSGFSLTSKYIFESKCVALRILTTIPVTVTSGGCWTKFLKTYYAH